MLPERAYWLAWAKIPNIGAILLKRIQQHFGSLAVAWQADATEFMAIEGFGAKLMVKIAQTRPKIQPEQLLKQYEAIDYWTPGDDNYPNLLKEIPSMPITLFYRGQIPAENRGSKPAIGIVGTRYPTTYGKRWTKKISAALAQKGFTIVSGMAAGIDTQAHQGCLEVGGKTIAVLGTGIDVVYPRSNKNLYQQIIQTGGLILSEYAPGTPPSRNNFPARNRIIAGLCRAILVMEAPQRSGALITARFANEFGRDVYVLPGSLDNQQAQGCLGLLNQGAQVILSQEHLLDMLGEIPQLDIPISQQSSQVLQKDLPALSTELKQVYSLISPEPIPYDLIIARSNLNPTTIAAHLLQLELMELITQLPGMRYQKL